MAFQFTLAAVLRYREGIEHNGYLALLQLQQQIVAARKELEQLRKELNGLRNSRQAGLKQGVSASYLHVQLEIEARAEQQKDASVERLRQLNTRLQNQIKNYHKARQRRETLEILRSQQLQAYRHDERVREQRESDELFLLRRKRPGQ